MFGTYDSPRPRRAIPRRATRTTMHLDLVPAKPGDMLRYIIRPSQSGWMCCPEKQRSRPFALAFRAWQCEGMACSAQSGAFKRKVTREWDTGQVKRLGDKVELFRDEVDGSRSREGNALRLSSCSARYHPAGKDRLLRAWGLPGKETGVFLLIERGHAESLQE